MNNINEFINNNTLFLDFLRMVKEINASKILQVYPDSFSNTSSYKVFYENDLLNQEELKEYEENSGIKIISVFPENRYEIEIKISEILNFLHLQILKGREIENEYKKRIKDLEWELRKKKFDEILNSPATDAWFELHNLKEKIMEERSEKLHISLETGGISMAYLIERLIKEHDKAYEDKMYNKGIQPHPNNKLYLLFNVAEKYGQKVNAEDTKTWNDVPFSTEIHFYKGYYFVTMWGQGAANFVLDSEENRIISL